MKTANGAYGGDEIRPEGGSKRTNTPHREYSCPKERREPGSLLDIHTQARLGWRRWSWSCGR